MTYSDKADAACRDMHERAAEDDRIKFMAQRDALATAACRLLSLHDDAVFVWGCEDDTLVYDALAELRRALKNALR